MQIFVAVLVAQSVFLLQVRVAPYQRPSDNLVAFFGSALLVFALLGSLGLQTKALGMMDLNETLLIVVLFATTLLVIVIALAFFLVELHARGQPIFRLADTHLPPVLPLAKEKQWHLFLSHR